MIPAFLRRLARRPFLRSVAFLAAFFSLASLGEGQGKPLPRHSWEVALLPPTPLSSLLIATTVNGNVPATFVFDTGCVYFLISDTLAAKLQAQPDPKYAGATQVFNHYPAAWVTRLGSLSFGPVHLDHVPAFVGTDKLFQLNADGREDFDGFLGALPLRQLKMAVAMYPRAGKLKFFQPGGLPTRARRAAGFGPRAFEVPLRWSEVEGGQWKCLVTLTQGGKLWTGWMTLDTGSAGTVISAEAAAQLGLSAERAGQAFGLGGVNSVLVAPVERLQVGNLSVAPVEQVTYPAPDNKLDDLLGMNVLGRYNVLLDFVASKMYLAPLEEPTATRR